MALPVGLGLLVAVLSYDHQGGVWYRLPFLLPYALSGAGLAMVWSPILSHDGIANLLLGVDTAFLQKAAAQHDRHAAGLDLAGSSA